MAVQPLWQVAAALKYVRPGPVCPVRRQPSCCPRGKDPVVLPVSSSSGERKAECRVLVVMCKGKAGKFPIVIQRVYRGIHSHTVRTELVRRTAYRDTKTWCMKVQRSMHAHTVPSELVIKAAYRDTKKQSMEV